MAVIAFLRIVASFFSVLPKETVGQLQWATERAVRHRKNRKSLKSMLNYREELYNKYIEFCPVCNKHTMVHYLLFSAMRLDTHTCCSGRCGWIHYLLFREMRLEMVFTTLQRYCQPQRREKSIMPSQLLAGQIEEASSTFSIWFVVYCANSSRFRRYSPYNILSIWPIHSAHSPARMGMPLPCEATAPTGMV